MKGSAGFLLSILGGLLLVLPFINGQANFTAPTEAPFQPSPVNMFGILEALTVDDPSDPLSGGTITVDSVKITVPRNLIVQLPSNYVLWSQIFNSDGTPNLPLFGQRSWETTVYANRGSTDIVAGMVFIMQEMAHLGQGFITHIDYSTGEFRVGGQFNDSSSGTRLVLNDPVGRYGLVHDEWPLWSADTENPSVFASSGFPVCIPRTDPDVEDDPLCPKKNRPLGSNGTPLNVFQFAATPVPDGDPDPNFAAPILVGDHVFYSATWVSDDLMAVYLLEDNLGFYTAPGSKPVYIVMSVANWGIIGNPAGEIGQTRIEGFVTDQDRNIEVFARNFDPCTGDVTERLLSVVVPRSAAVRGQWRYRTNVDDIMPATREVSARISGEAAFEQGNGLQSGQFISPILAGGWIWPELIVFGQNQIPDDFQLLPILTQGIGPFAGGLPGADVFSDPPIVGQLDPWPDTIGFAPAAAVCPTGTVPAANAGPDATVLPGALVTLAGTTSTPNATGLDWKWSQTSGPPANVTNAHNQTATFRVPSNITDTKFAFNLTLSDGSDSTVNQVTFTVQSSAVDIVTIDEIDYSNGKGTGILSVLAHTNVVDGSAFLQLSTLNPTILPTNMTADGDGHFHLLFNVKPEPELIVVSSNLGGEASNAVANRGNLGVVVSFDASLD